MVGHVIHRFCLIRQCVFHMGKSRHFSEPRIINRVLAALAALASLAAFAAFAALAALSVVDFPVDGPALLRYSPSGGVGVLPAAFWPRWPVGCPMCPVSGRQPKGD